MQLNRHAKFKYLAFLVIICVFLGCNNDVKARPSAPDFSLYDLSGNKVSLKDYRGDVVLLDFWATWCPPCRRSIPELVDINNRYRDRGLVILGISVDDPRQANNRYLSAFKEKFGMNYMILRSDRKVTMDYFGTENFSIPTLFVVNREGKIVNKYEGFSPGAVERSMKKMFP